MGDGDIIQDEIEAHGTACQVLPDEARNLYDKDDQNYAQLRYNKLTISR